MKKDMQLRIGACIRVARLKPVHTPVRLNYCFYESNRRRDKDNIAAIAHKFIQDALVQCDIIPDDGWANIESFSDSFFVDKDNPRIEVVINEPKQKNH